MSVIVNGPVSGLSDAEQTWVADGAAGGALDTAAYQPTTAFDAAGAAAAAQAAAVGSAATLDEARVPFTGDEADKKNLLFNLAQIPDVSADNFTDRDLRSLAFIQAKSHFAGGRLNHYGVYLNNAAQYSFTYGWNCNAIDPTATGTSDGSGAKGQVIMGYGGTGFSPYVVNLGFHNGVNRIGSAIGRYNLISSAEPNLIVAHNWTSPTGTQSVEISGDLTSSYTPGKFVLMYLVSSVGGTTPAMSADRVVSSVYSGGRTIITLTGKSDYQATVTPFFDSNNIYQSCWIDVAPSSPGNPTGGAFGAYNRVFANSFVLGTGHRVYKESGAAIGKQAVVKNLGEIAFSSGAYPAFGGQRWAQESLWVLKAATLATSDAKLTLDGAAAASTNQIVMQEKSTYTLEATVSGAFNSGAEAGGAKLQAVVFRDGSNNLTIVGQSVLWSNFSAGFGTPTIAFTVDAPNRAIQVQVTPGTTDTTYWTASVRGTMASREAPAATT